MKSRYILVLFIFLLSITIYLFFAAYEEAKQNSIEELNSRQLILAEQSKAEIEYFFDDIIQFLTRLSTSQHIVNFDDTGRQEMEVALNIRPEGIKAITRVNKDARIIYTTPYNSTAINQDVSAQKHVQKIWDTKRPVVSDVFNAVQGYRAIAVHVPVFRNYEFKGTLAVLIDFQTISKQSLQNMHIGKAGYTWLISQNGIELYSPFKNHDGKPVLEAYRNFPGMLSMAKKMMQAQKGKTSFHRTRTEHAVYLPIKIADSLWSVAIVSPEQETLSSLVNLRNRFILITGFLTLLVAVFFYYSLKVWGIMRAEEVREKAANEIQRLSQFRESIIDTAQIWLNALNKDGKITLWNKTAEEISGYKKEEVSGHSKIWEWLYPDEAYRNEVFTKASDILNDDESVSDLETTIQRKDGKTRTISWRSQSLKDEQGNIIGSLALGRDITDQKAAEEEKDRLFTELQEALENVKALSGLLPVCASCKKVKDDQGYWNSLESYLEQHADVSVTHGLCQDCMDKMYSKQDWYKKIQDQ